LVGNNIGGRIEICYASGAVSGIGSVGGLVGYNSGTVSGSFDKSGTGQRYGVGISYSGTTLVVDNPNAKRHCPDKYNDIIK